MYKPYHGWRHGYRRERAWKWLVRIAKLMLLAEGIVLASRYVKQNIYEKVYERDVFWSDERADESSGTKSDDRDDLNHLGDFYGIGIGAEDGSLFWFHQKTEEVSESRKEASE